VASHLNFYKVSIPLEKAITTKKNSTCTLILKERTEDGFFKRGDRTIDQMVQAARSGK
jgi:hypothetical protein